MEDDVNRLLADPPPPRPARRSATIASALERFDGFEASSTMQHAPAPRTRAWWRTGRAQVGALASVVLVALVGIPLALEHPDGRLGAPPIAAPPQAGDVAVPAPDDVGSKRIAVAPRSVPPASAELRTPAVTVPARSNSADVAQSTTSPPFVASAPPPPAAAPPAATAPPPPPPAPLAASEALADSSDAARRGAPVEDGSDVVVTGSRISRKAAAASRRGDWNACTVADPERRLHACARLVRRGGKGAAGEAAVKVADGLALAWQDDWTGAIAAFDRAIELQPRLGFAYLNRGLALERLRDTDRAIADLDRAVRYDPSPRSYYQRARIRRASGEVRGAEADEARAVDLDPNYARLLQDKRLK